MEALISILFWFIFSGLVAFIASKKKRNPFGWFMLAFILSPIFIVIVLLIVGDYCVECPSCKGKVDKYAKKCAHCGQLLKATTPESVSTFYASEAANEPQALLQTENDNKDDKYELLEKVKKLLDDGILSQEEYETEKKKLLLSSTE
jgi:Short C-terminal domain